MGSPFFGNYWNSPYPSYSRSRGGFPSPSRSPSPSPSPSPKVVSVPVHFVGSEKTRSAAVLKIQKTFRGFLVRKSVKKIVAYRREVDEIERKISQKETVDLIRIDAKERLKVNEMLMALLFRLDSVRGVDSAVRDCRKAVIRKAISLQEKVDEIVAAARTLDVVDGRNTMDQTRGTEDNGDSSCHCKTVADEAVNQTLEIKDPANFSDSCEIVINQTLGSNDQSLDIQDLANSLDSSITGDDAVDRIREVQDPVESLLKTDDPGATLKAANQTIRSEVAVEPNNNRETSSECVKEPEIAKFGIDSGTKADEGISVSEETPEYNNATPPSSEASSMENQTGYSDNSYSLIEGGDEDCIERQECVTEIQPLDHNKKFSEHSLVAEGRKKGQDSTRDLMERMIEDNAKLMGLMTDLFERNAMQTRLISSLSQRVEQLERAFTSERLRRKKKRQAAGMTERLEAETDGRKCGKKY